MFCLGKALIWLPKMLQYYTIYDILSNPLCIGVMQELCSKLNSMKGPLIETSESAHILFLFFWNFCHERGNPYIAFEFYLALQIPVLILSLIHI